MLRSLAFKWTATLLLTSLIGVVLVGLFATRTTITEFDRLRNEQARDAFINDVTAYYEVKRTWEGVESWLRIEPEGAKVPILARPPQQFALMDAQGRVVAGWGPFDTGDLLPADLLAQVTPIMLDGVQVGMALLVDRPDLDPRERRYLEGTTSALILGAVGASATALLIGLLLSRQFLRPLSQLTQAITAMHTGELDQRVEIHTRDELGVLAQTFNEMSAKLARANQLRKQMTADIAHDLRTPLTVIGGYLEALRDGTLKPTPERFRVMSEEVRLLQRLVEDLRTLSLADAGELRLLRRDTSLAELLERTQQAFHESASAAAIQLHIKLEPALPELYLDAERLLQVLGNLLSNALRHTPAGGTITLEAYHEAGGVILAVADTGSGIAPEDLPKVFDRLYRADPARQGEESGLGLAIARSIVEAHGGTIRAESSLGKGTRMLIFLPKPSL